jgi:alkaline phosphatase D
MKMTAQMMPVGEYQSQTVKLETKQGEKWKEKATANIIVPGYTATFRIENWPDNKDIDYRINYNYINTDQDTNVFYWQGKVRKNPVEKEKIVVAGFTGNHQLERPGIDAGSYVYDLSHIWFPHNDLVENLKKQNPDVLFFSGDQIYEAASPTYWKGSDMHLDYLYRWYLWCWEFRELTKDIPTICIPDDHDVFQGNLWGESGRKTDKDDKGGFVHPPEIVNMVQRTQCNHLPDPYDSGTIEQDITLYYTDMNYGNISFAILEDRKFKSGPNGKVPKTNSNRADHVIDENFDPETADLPGLKLLGDKQLEFLNKWAANWEQANMKIALSQTVFANMANHHGPNLSYLVADYDANGWPQTGRNKALDAIRRGHGFMLCGDQHLATLVKHGINDWDDAGWSFCVPSIANFYPRAWMPKEDPVEKIEGTAEYCGKYTDGFGNKVSVWAHTNPRDMGKKPKALHDRMPGYGILKLNKKDLTITIENWPRYADPEKDEQYEGWPKTISIEENYGRKAVAWLPEIQITGMENPVIQIINERNDRIEYTIRVNGTSWKPKVFETGTYTVKIGEPGTDNMETVENVQSVGENSEETLAVDF